MSAARFTMLKWHPVIVGVKQATLHHLYASSLWEFKWNMSLFWGFPSEKVSAADHHVEIKVWKSSNTARPRRTLTFCLLNSSGINYFSFSLARRSILFFGGFLINVCNFFPQVLVQDDSSRKYYVIWQKNLNFLGWAHSPQWILYWYSSTISELTQGLCY